MTATARAAAVRRGRRVPAALGITAAAVALLCALPAFYLLVVVGGDPGEAWQAIREADTVGLLVRSVGLAAAVGLTTMALGIPLAWLTSRTNLPGRKAWAAVCALPLVIPSYIGAYLLIAALGPRGALADLLSPVGVERLPSLYGFVGAWL
ncbi:MAG: iron ABC transporter permease, partial [Actinomycetes bacterium]